MPAFDEELFGPVAAVVEAADVEEAIALANATQYGLGASLWTADTARGQALARRIEAGMTVDGGATVLVTNDLTAKELEIIRAGGLLNQVRRAR